MKKYILLGSFLTIFLLGGSAVFAQTTTPKEDVMKARLENKQAIENRRQETQSRIEQRKTEMQQKRQQMMERKINARTEKVISKLDATLTREVMILEKIENRILKVQTNGGNVTEANALVLDAKNHLNLASTTLSVMKNWVWNNASTTNSEISVSKDNLDRLKKMDSEIKEHLRNAHKSMMKIVGVLRGVSQTKTDDN